MQRCDWRDDDGNRCTRRARGSLGMMVLCFKCFAKLAGFSAKDSRVRHGAVIELANGTKHVGRSEWRPFWKEERRGK